MAPTVPRFGRAEIDDKFKFGWLLNWYVCGQPPLQYLGYKLCTLSTAPCDLVTESGMSALGHKRT